MRERGGGRFFQTYASGALRRENLEAAALAWLNRLPDGDDANEEHAAQLRELGVAEDQIEAAIAQAAEFADEDDTGEVVLWRENLTTFEVFTRCQWQTSVLSGMDGAVRVFEGISAQEIRAACELLDVPRGEWRDVVMGVSVMQAAAQPVLNQAR